MTDAYAQLTLTNFDDPIALRTQRRKAHRVRETLAEIGSLREKLNTQLQAHPTERPAIHSPADIYNLISLFLEGLDHEEFWVIDLDIRNRVIHLAKLYQGSVNSSQIRVAEVFRIAILDNAHAMVICHNHPSGDPMPSPDDVGVTRSIMQAGKLLDIEVLDHLVVGGGRYMSLKERGLMSP